MSSSPNTVTIPVSLTVENLLQVIATLSEQIRRLEAEREATTEAEIPPHIVAVISAAVHATAGSRARIVKMAHVAENLSWSTEGRRAIFHSHAVR